MQLPRLVLTQFLVIKTTLRPSDSFGRWATKHTGVNEVESDEEREIGVVQVLSTAAKAMKAKAKWLIVLNCGFGPAKAMKKLKVKSLKDKEFRRFARYYARYLARNPKKATSLPATAEDAAMGVKMNQWLAERVAPPQIEAKLQEFGQTNIRKYAEEYMKMWGANQVKLSNNIKRINVDFAATYYVVRVRRASKNTYQSFWGNVVHWRRPAE